MDKQRLLTKMMLGLFCLIWLPPLSAQTPFPSLQDTTFLQNIISKTPSSLMYLKNTVGYEKALSYNKSVKLSAGITVVNVIYR